MPDNTPFNYGQVCDDVLILLSVMADAMPRGMTGHDNCDECNDIQLSAAKDMLVTIRAAGFIIIKDHKS